MSRLIIFEKSENLGPTYLMELSFWVELVEFWEKLKFFELLKILKNFKNLKSYSIYFIKKI